MNNLSAIKKKREKATHFTPLYPTYLQYFDGTKYGDKILWIWKITTYLRHFDGGHGVNMETEYLGSGESDDEALQLLLMRREIAGFDAEESVAAVAEHIFVLRIPSH